MSKLEELVPPLELCKKIPEGHFEDSGLMWELEVAANRYHGEWWEVVFRCNREDEEYYPAPTLAEIMAELDNGRAKSPFCELLPNGKWRCSCFDWDRATNVITDENPAAAALKLWLELQEE